MMISLDILTTPNQELVISLGRDAVWESFIRTAQKRMIHRMGKISLLEWMSD